MKRVVTGRDVPVTFSGVLVVFDGVHLVQLTEPAFPPHFFLVKFFAAADGEHRFDGFGRDGFTEAGDGAVNECDGRALGMGAGDAGAFLAVDFEVHQIEAKVARFGPEDVGVVDFDEENSGVVGVGDVFEGDGF